MAGESEASERVVWTWHTLFLVPRRARRRPISPSPLPEGERGGRRELVGIKKMSDEPMQATNTALCFFFLSFLLFPRPFLLQLVFVYPCLRLFLPFGATGGVEKDL